MSANVLRKKFTDALIARYESMYREADAHLHLYMNRQVGIGEHSDLLEECDKFVKQMVDAKDNLEMIKKWCEENNKHNETFVIE